VDTPSPTETTETGIAIEESGGIWTVAYEGRNTNLRGGIGLRYLQILLSRPNEEIPCLKLFSLARERDPSDPRMAALTPPADPVVDTWTLRAVEKQLAETKAELEDAKSTHDIERQEVLQERLTKIEGYIAGARGIGGKTRVHSTPEEKARKSVGRAIDRGVQKIRGVWPELASQLDDCVERGACCRYTPLLHGA
jgi:hypothetical protein